MPQNTHTNQPNIIQIQQFIQKNRLQPLAVTADEMTQIANKMIQKERQHVTRFFFITALSQIRTIPYDVLISALSKDPIERPGIKRSATYEGEELPAPKKSRRERYAEDQENRLYMEPQDTQLHTQVEKTGVRSTVLTPATPTKEHPITVRSPGGTKVRPFGDFKAHIGNTKTHLALFKPITPEKNRAPLTHKGNGKIPFSFDRASPVTFIATLAQMNARENTPRRQSQGSIMGTSAASVFIFHGVKISPAQKASYHWSHLIAHFLGDTQDLSREDASTEIVNLVPSTATANYNTLRTIEYFIRDKLKKGSTKQIHIKVTPEYSDEILIPRLLTYALTWDETDSLGAIQHHENTYSISPQSYERITKKELESIECAREGLPNGSHGF